MKAKTAAGTTPMWFTGTPDVQFYLLKLCTTPTTSTGEGIACSSRVPARTVCRGTRATAGESFHFQDLNEGPPRGGADKRFVRRAARS